MLQLSHLVLAGGSDLMLGQVFGFEGSLWEGEVAQVTALHFLGQRCAPGGAASVHRFT